MIIRRVDYTEKELKLMATAAVNKTSEEEEVELAVANT